MTRFFVHSIGWRFWLLAGALWLLSTPYIGIDHDARLYTLMAMRWLSPDAYARDPWFAFSSQDQWSVFSPLFSGVLQVFGVEWGAMMLTLAGGMLFIFGGWRLARECQPKPISWFSILLLVSVPLCYSAKGMLYVSEGFATARSLAVPLSLVAVSYSIGNRFGKSAFWHLTALVLHPSMAFGPAAVSILLAMNDRILVGTIASACVTFVIVLFAGALGQLPTIDAAWLSFVSPAILVFVRPWLESHLLEVLAPISLLLLGCRWGIPRARRLYGFAALVSTMGLLFSLLAADYVQVTVVLQAQVWRALWFAKVVAILALADLAIRYILRRHAPAKWGLAVVLLMGYGLGPISLTLIGIWAAGILLPLVTWQRIRSLMAGQQFLFRILAGLLVLIFLPTYLSSMSLAATSLNTPSMLPDTLVGLLRTGGTGLLAGGVWWLLWKGKPSWIALCGLIALAGGVSLWDERSEVQRHWESKYHLDGGRRVFADRISRGDTVYWHDSVPRVWMELGTSGYAGTVHTTGMIFSRERTHLLENRMQKVAIRALTEKEYRSVQSLSQLVGLANGRSFGEDGSDPFLLAAYESSRASTRFGITQLCKDKHLDYVIDPMGYPGLYVATELEQIGGRTVSLYLYECAKIRPITHIADDHA